MNRSAVYSLPEGSAERVIAHANYQQSRGRKPAMAFVGQQNPEEALKLAKLVLKIDELNKFRSDLGGLLVGRLTYDKMSSEMLKAAVRNIITMSFSEEEVQRRVQQELRYPGEIFLCSDLPTDATGREARELVRGLGGLIMKNGAMAMAMLWDRDGEVIHV